MSASGIRIRLVIWIITIADGGDEDEEQTFGDRSMISDSDLKVTEGYIQSRTFEVTGG